MLINGEKWACEACVRGHRVSNCNHTERKLQHIAKKGRPVSQCAHCRTLRKSRSAHVKCDCGDKAHSRASCTAAKEGDSKDMCCCSHGGRCSCAHKKQELDAVPESESDEATRAATAQPKPRRPRASTLQSDGNGSHSSKSNHSHHEVLKHNLAQQRKQQGQQNPYVAPRHPIQGAGSLLANRSVDNLLQLKDIQALHGDSRMKDSIVSAQQEKQRQIKSEHVSPVLPPSTTNLEQLNSQLPPLDLNLASEFNFNGPPSNDFNNAYYPSMDNSFFPADLSAATASVDWSHYDGLDFNNFSNHNNNPSFAISNYSQAPSNYNFDFNTIEPQPALTNASGDLSEVDDFYLGNSSRMPHTQKYGSDLSDMDTYRPFPQQNYTLPQQNVPPPAPSNSSSNFDLDELLRVEKEAAMNGELNQTFGPPFQEKFAAHQTFDAFAIPADEVESPWYTYTTPPNSIITNPDQEQNNFFQS